MNELQILNHKKVYLLSYLSLIEEHYYNNEIKKKIQIKDNQNELKTESTIRGLLLDLEGNLSQPSDRINPTITLD